MSNLAPWRPSMGRTLALIAMLVPLVGLTGPAASSSPPGDRPVAAIAEPQGAPSVPSRLRAFPTRRYRLSASPIQNWPGEEPFSRLAHPPQYTVADVAAHVDVLAVFVEHYGVPWPEFVAGPEPPADHVWTRTMKDAAAAAAATGRPVSLQMVLSRDRVAGLARATDGGTLQVVSDWTPPCFDFAKQPAYATAYARYVRWMVRQFQPQYVNVGVEIDKAWRACASRWKGIVNVQRQAYDAAKAERSSAVTFISVNAEDLYGQSPHGFDEAAYAALSELKRDRLGLSTYPSGLRDQKGAPLRAGQLPADYFVRARVRHPDEVPIVIAETGWNSRDLKLGTPESCTTIVASSDAEQSTYVDVVLDAARAHDLELVTWFSLRDVLPPTVMDTCYVHAPAPAYEACQGDVWCLGVNIYRQIAPNTPMTGDLVFKGFGSMGLAHYAGQPKPALERWRQHLEAKLVR